MASSVAPTVTAERAARLAKLLKLTAAKTPRPRETLLDKLKIDLRSFYRDVKLLRERGVALAVTGDAYRLDEELHAAQGKLPCPDMGLSIADLHHLSRGSSDAHKRLQRLLHTILGESAKR